MRQAEIDDQGNFHVGPYSRRSTGRLTVDFDSGDLNGVAFDVAASPAAGSERAGLQLGDFFIGQDTAKSGTKNFGVLDANGVLLLSLVAGAPSSAGMTTAKFSTLVGGTPLTLVGADMAGGETTVINLTNALAGAGTLNSATAGQIVAATPGAAVGLTYLLRIINASSGAFAWTLTTAGGITLAGTMSIAQNTWRDFIVTLTSLTAVSIQSIGTGTNS